MFDANEYFKKAVKRITPEAIRILKLEATEGTRMNKELVSIYAKVRRAQVDHSILELNALGFVGITKEGKSVCTYATDLGRGVYEQFIKGREAEYGID